MENQKIEEEEQISSKNDSSSPSSPKSTQKILVTGDGGIVKEILKEPPPPPEGTENKSSYETPAYETFCTYHVNIEGDGTVYLDTNSSAPAQLVIGDEDIPLGLELGLLSMKRGEIAKFLVKFPYTRTDTDTKLYNFPIQSDITFIIHLIDFQTAEDPWKINNFEEKYKLSIKRKEEGNKFFNEKKFGLAARKYTRSLDFVTQGGSTFSDSQKAQLKKDVELPCYLNLAACDLETKQYKTVIDVTTRALELDPDNCKGLWRRGRAYTEIGNWIEAERDLKRSLEVAGSAQEKKTVSQSYYQLKKLMADQDKKDKEKFRKIFVDPVKFYADLLKEIKSIIQGETDLFANTANVASILHEQLNKIKQNKVNWTGFYWLHNDGQLVLSTFQGKVACTRIQKGKGVCGAAVETKQTQLVPDVHKFEGHIACDSASNSEIVIPIMFKGSVVGVLDIDSIVTDGFDHNDQEGLEKIVRLLEEKCQWSQLTRVTRVTLIKKKPATNRNSLIMLSLMFVGIVTGVFFYFRPNFRGMLLEGSQQQQQSPVVKSIISWSDRK